MWGGVTGLSAEYIVVVSAALFKCFLYAYLIHRHSYGAFLYLW